MSEVQIREFHIDDAPFVYDAWLKSYRDSSLAQWVPKHHYFAGQTARINRLAQKPEASILVATIDDEPGVILGFIAFEPEVIHYCYVKQTWRLSGIARKLIEASGLIQGASFTHWTTLCGAVSQRKDIKLRYNPYLF